MRISIKEMQRMDGIDTTRDLHSLFMMLKGYLLYFRLGVK